MRSLDRQAAGTTVLTLASLAVAAVLLSVPEPAQACAACIGGTSDNRFEFILTTALLSVLPFGLIGGIKKEGGDAQPPVALGKPSLPVVFTRDVARHARWLTRRWDGGRTRGIDHLRRLKRPTDSLDQVPEALLAVDAVEPAWLKIPPDLLSPRQTLVLELLYQKDLTPAEAGEILGVDPQTVRSTHHKALTRLRSHFAEETEG